MELSIKTLFSLTDGRMSTNMDDIYGMLDFIFETEHTTIGLPSAYDRLKQGNQAWFIDAVKQLNEIKAKHNTNDFEELMTIFDTQYRNTYVKLAKFQ